MAKGRGGRAWERIKRDVYARREPCCRCNQPIDYSLPYIDPLTGKPNPKSKSVDHYPRPLSTHPHLAQDPSNLHAAHLLCNMSAGNNTQTEQTEFGQPSETW